MSHFSKFQYNAVSQSKTCTTVSLPQEDMGYVIGKGKSGLRRIEQKLGNKVRIEARGCTFFITAVDVESVEKLEIAVELIAAIAWLKGKDTNAWMKEMRQFYYTELHSKFSEMCGHFSDLDEHTHRMKAIHEIYAIEFEKATSKYLNDHNIRLNTFCYLVGLSYINSKEIDLYVNTAAHYELFCKMLNNLCRKPIERKITIDPNYLGRFIGKKGDNIRKMERTFDVKIYVRENITIQGKPEKVEVVIEYIKGKYPTQTPIIPQPHPERGHMYMDLQEKIMKTWRAKSFETIINNESHRRADSQFESLEHYGDSILKVMVVEILFNNNYPQGMMHDMEDRILSNRNLCKIFELLHMEALYTVQPSQFEIEVQKEKADVMEALIALLKKVNEVDILDSLISLITKIGSDHYIRSSTFNSAFIQNSN